MGALVAELRERLADDLAVELAVEFELVDGKAQAGLRVNRRPGGHDWPATLPLPLTVGAALDAVDQGRELVAEAVAGDIAATVEALVEPEAQAAVLARENLAERWPWRTPPLRSEPQGWVGPSFGPELALALVRDYAAKGGALVRPCDALNWWPDPHLAAATVAEWARDPLNRLHPARPADYAQWLRLNGLRWDGDTPPDADDLAGAARLLAKRGVHPATEAEFAAEYPGKPGAGDRLVAEVAEHGRIVRLRAVQLPDRLYGELRPAALALVYLAERAALATLPSHLEAVAWRAVRSWASLAPGDAHNTAARAALDLDGGDAAADAEALRLLAAELCAFCRTLAATVAPTPEPPGGGELRTRAGMLALDADLANCLTTVHKDHADRLREKASKRLAGFQRGTLEAADLFERWVERDGARTLASVAETLWLARVAELWRRGRSNRPGMVRAVVADTLIPAMTRQIVLPGLDDGAIRDTRGRELGRIATMDVATFDAVRHGLDLLGSVTGHRLVRFLVHCVHDQAERGAADPRAVELLGGFSGLAEAVRYARRDFDALRSLLQAGQHVEWTHPAVHVGGLWTWTHARGNATRPGMVRIVVGDALAPGLAARLSQSGDSSPLASKARRIVPELRAEPPVSAVNERHQGPAWTLHRLVLVELVDRAEELHRDGCVTMDPARLRELATAARLPPAELPRLLDSWRVGDDAAPPLLVEPAPGHFTLAQPHAAELAFIAELGRRRSEGRERARAGKQRKAGKTRKAGRGKR
ncbi:MAG: hypothetical protein FJ255_12510 [Phycisphaerae bacterium]|nr:hypothetical protein [Phycisphaerae bacterium]